jgi:PAS domain S-box-containing protein
MSASGFLLSYLRDDKLAPLATSALPAWLWSTDATRIVWANPIGAAIFAAPMAAENAASELEPGESAAAQIARIAATLPLGAPPRLERLPGFGAGVGRAALTCACSHIALADGTSAVLVVAAERAGPDMTLAERTLRLLAGCNEAIAAFTPDGELLAATEKAQPHLQGATALAALGAQMLAADALASGHAAGRIDGGQFSHRVSIDRVGSTTATVLIADFAPPDDTEESAAAATGPIASPPDKPAERHHPLRFVWQMSEDGCFTLGSDEFIALIGPRAAAAIGRPWREIEPDIDPEGQIARAVATRDTWSGLTVLWPADDSPERLPVELSGLPVFDRERIFRGYRGFGVCRDLGRLTVLAQRLHSPRAAEAQAALAQKPPPDAPGAENIVPFPAAAEPATPALSPIERSAFHELSRKLSQRLTAAGIEHDNNVEIITPVENAGALAEPSLPDAVPDAQPVFDRLPVGILVYRLDHLLYANPAFLQWSGHQSLEGLVEAGGLDELFIEPIGAAAAGDDKSLTLAIDRGDKISVRGELIDITWQGEPAHALVTAAQSAPAAGEPDKLARTQAELAELESILDTATDGVVLLDAQGLIVSANRSAQALFGYDSHELAGRTYTDLFAPESAGAAREYLEGLTGDGVASLLNSGREIIGRVRQGGLIPLFMTMGRIGDRTDKLCVVFRDITPWKKAEEGLTQAKRDAERASSAKSDFLAKISHEIRTPLNAIIGFSEVMMEERFGPVGNERYREYLKDIHASGGHLLSLINDLLDLSKIEAGKLELTFAGVALNDLIQQCVAIMQPQANRERVIIRTSLPPSLPQVIADARSVRQIVLNLLSNSIKFTGAGGQVIVSTALNDNGELVLRVRDTGVGMTEADLVTAMEPFRQLATSTRGGTGLGLPLTKALAEANQATFYIRSAPKDGTLVEITFPPSRVLAG